MNQTLKTIAEQINSKELIFARFKLSYSEGKDEHIAVRKGTKFIKIEYKYDTYTVTKLKIRKFEIIEVEKLENVYHDMLQGIISEYFNFEYVMEGLLNPVKV